MSIEAENELISKVEELIQSREFAKVCFETGKFVESIANELYTKTTSSKAKNAKEAIDFMINSKAVPRPLGYKLHVVRELRNVEAHNLPYTISHADVRLAVDTLNQIMEWLHQGALARIWQRIQGDFYEGKQFLFSSQGDLAINGFSAIRMIFDALESALRLKVESLQIRVGNPNFFSYVQVLVEYGVDIRSDAWRKLTDLRNNVVHRTIPTDSVYALDSLKMLMPDLEDILILLCPLDPTGGSALDYPKVSESVIVAMVP